jgi:hypothetical protein
MVETVTSQRSDHALDVPVLPGGAGCRTHVLYAHAVDRGGHRGEVAVPIVEEEPRYVVVGKRLAELLGRPGCRGMRGDRDMHEASSLVREHDEHEEEAVRHRWHDEEVAGDDLRGMRGEKGPPVW